MIGRDRAGMRGGTERPNVAPGRNAVLARGADRYWGGRRQGAADSPEAAPLARALLYPYPEAKGPGAPPARSTLPPTSSRGREKGAARGPRAPPPPPPPPESEAAGGIGSGPPPRALLPPYSEAKTRGCPLVLGADPTVLARKDAGGRHPGAGGGGDPGEYPLLPLPQGRGLPRTHRVTLDQCLHTATRLGAETHGLAPSGGRRAGGKGGGARGSAGGVDEFLPEGAFSGGGASRRDFDPAGNADGWDARDGGVGRPQVQGDARRRSAPR